MDVLTLQRYKQYDKLSRYQVFPIYWNKLDEVYTNGTTANLYDDTSFIYHTVKRGETLDMLSLYYYNNPVYFWIIADFNRIQNPFDSLDIGSQIKIPTFSDIEFKV